MPKRARTTALAIRVLAAISALISLYLFVTSIQGGHVAGCGPASDCEDALTSEWAYWMGLPVSGAGLLAYGSIVLAAFRVTPPAPRAIRRKAWLFLAFAACVVSAAAVWFLTLQVFFLEHVCPYCVTAHVSGVAAAALIFRATGNPLRRPKVRNAAGLAIAALIAGQWINQPPTHEVRSVAASSPAPDPEPAQGRQIEILDGQFKIDLDKVPLIGRPGARVVIVSLFDYTCHHCRKMHELLLAAEEAHRDEIVIANLPMPLDTACNRVVRQTAPEHTDACNYARLGLAVWRADKRQMARFNHWIFEPRTPPGMDSALGFASEIVGEDALRRALDDRWVREQLEQDIAIYKTISESAGSGAMPQLIIGTNVVLGELKNGMQDMERVLGEFLKR